MKIPSPRPLLARFVLAAVVLCPNLARAQALQLPPGCQPAAPVTCSYLPAAAYSVGEVDRVLIDTGRNNHLIPVRIRYPIGAQGPLPVVIWSHGGATTNIVNVIPPGIPVTRGQQSSERRGRSFAAAGYVVVHVGRLAVDNAALTAAQLLDCTRVGVTAAALIDADPATTPRDACRIWTGWHLYGPQNVAHVADRLGVLRALMPADFSGSFDREKLVIGGWSGGTQAVMNIAGANQRWEPVGPFANGVTLPATAVPGVVAFFADAPRRPGYISGTSNNSGFQAAGLQRIDERPFLFNSGSNDMGPDVAPTAARGLPWLSAMPGGKVLAWDRTGIANHATVNLGNNDGGIEDGCRPALNQVAHCLWYADLGLAFLDAAVKQRPAAVAWIYSDAFKVLTGGAIELHRR
ncbi:MAG: hypothetical protein ACOVOT_15140 [Rubrivivax sp.]